MEHNEWGQVPIVASINDACLVKEVSHQFKSMEMNHAALTLIALNACRYVGVSSCLSCAVTIHSLPKIEMALDAKPSANTEQTCSTGLLLPRSLASIQSTSINVNSNKTSPYALILAPPSYRCPLHSQNAIVDNLARLKPEDIKGEVPLLSMLGPSHIF